MIKQIVPQLAEGGKIKIGGLGEARPKRGGGTFRLPAKYDHFLITTTDRDANGDFAIDEDLMEALAPHADEDGQLRQIPIFLHSDEVEEVFPTTYALYHGRKMLCRGDGVTALRHETRDGKKTGRSGQVACPCNFLDAKAGMICKPHGTLHCSINAPGRAVAGAVHYWRTTSRISIQRMLGSLMQIRNVVGTLTGIPLWLVLDPVDVAPPDAESSTVYCCHVELRAKDIEEVREQAIESARMRDRVAHSMSYRALVAPPALDESDATQADTQDEFHPDLSVEEDGPADDDCGGSPEDKGPVSTNAGSGNGNRQVREPERRSAGNGSGRAAFTPSTAQIGRLFSIARSAHHDEADVHAWLRHVHGIEDPAEIATRAQYDDICRRLSSIEALPVATGDTPKPVQAELV